MIIGAVALLVIIAIWWFTSSSSGFVSNADYSGSNVDRYDYTFYKTAPNANNRKANLIRKPMQPMQHRQMNMQPKMPVNANSNLYWMGKATGNL